MDEMLQDANLDKFRVQFEKLHNALQDATQSNGRLQVKNREVNAELVANAAKVSKNTIYASKNRSLVGMRRTVTNIDCHQLLKIISDGSIIKAKPRWPSGYSSIEIRTFKSLDNVWFSEWEGATITWNSSDL